MRQSALALPMNSLRDDALGHRDALSNSNHVTHAFNMILIESTDKEARVDSQNYNDSVPRA